jgi:hypothetical protein
VTTFYCTSTAQVEQLLIFSSDAEQERSASHRIVHNRRGSVGWAIDRDSKIWRIEPRNEVLGALLDAYLAGASSYDAEDIAKVIERRPRPSYEERLTVFNATGRPETSRDLFPIFEGRWPPNCLTARRVQFALS